LDRNVIQEKVIIDKRNKRERCSIKLSDFERMEEKEIDEIVKGTERVKRVT
jgi:PHD/YefM family antitoxin component YafN of YafNO toxin-antitoxin module